MSDDQDPLEMLRCSQVNFDNLTAVNPAVANHPMYKVARMQLDEAVTVLTSIVEGRTPAWIRCTPKSFWLGADVTDGEIKRALLEREELTASLKVQILP